MSPLKVACRCGTRSYGSEDEALDALAKITRLRAFGRPGTYSEPVGVLQCFQGVWHLKEAAEVLGFSPEVIEQTRKRAGNACEYCGMPVPRWAGNVHHRLGRGMGGCRLEVVNSTANAALLDGTPFTGCHGLATANDPDIARRRLRAAPRGEPAARAGAHQRHGRVRAPAVADGRRPVRLPPTLGGSVTSLEVLAAIAAPTALGLVRDVLLRRSLRQVLDRVQIQRPPVKQATSPESAEGTPAAAKPPVRSVAS